MRQVVLCLSVVSLVALGTGLIACAESTGDAGLNPQPLPPEDDKGKGGETPAPPEDRGMNDTPGASGGVGQASADAGADASEGGR